MQITRNGHETGRGPADWFTGNVYIDTIASPSDASRVGAAVVHFTPGARTAWHTHPNGQRSGSARASASASAKAARPR
jgi:quercetin dioxygenase-like cupin family protein